MITYHLHFIPYMTPMWAVVEVTTYSDETSSSYVKSTHQSMEEALKEINMLGGSHPLGVKIT